MLVLADFFAYFPQTTYFFDFLPKRGGFQKNGIGKHTFVIFRGAFQNQPLNPLIMECSRMQIKIKRN